MGPSRLFSLQFCNCRDLRYLATLRIQYDIHLIQGEAQSMFADIISVALGSCAGWLMVALSPPETSGPRSATLSSPTRVHDNHNRFFTFGNPQAPLCLESWPMSNDLSPECPSFASWHSRWLESQSEISQGCLESPQECTQLFVFSLIPLWPLSCLSNCSPNC